MRIKMTETAHTEIGKLSKGRVIDVASYLAKSLVRKKVAVFLDRVEEPVRPEAYSKDNPPPAKIEINLPEQEGINTNQASTDKKSLWGNKSAKK